MSDFKAKCAKFNFGWGSAPDHWGLTTLSGLLAGFKGATSKGRGGVGYERVEGTVEKREYQGTEEEVTPKGWFIPRCPKSWKIPWLQNWSDWQERQHRRLPRAANTLAPPLVKLCQRDAIQFNVICMTFSWPWPSPDRSLGHTHYVHDRLFFSFHLRIFTGAGSRQRTRRIAIRRGSLWRHPISKC